MDKKEKIDLEKDKSWGHGFLLGAGIGVFGMIVLLVFAVFPLSSELASYQYKLKQDKAVVHFDECEWERCMNAGYNWGYNDCEEDFNVFKERSSYEVKEVPECPSSPDFEITPSPPPEPASEEIEPFFIRDLYRDEANKVCPENMFYDTPLYNSDYSKQIGFSCIDENNVDYCYLLRDENITSWGGCDNIVQIDSLSSSTHAKENEVVRNIIVENCKNHLLSPSFCLCYLYGENCEEVKDIIYSDS